MDIKYYDIRPFVRARRPNRDNINTFFFRVCPLQLKIFQTNIKMGRPCEGVCKFFLIIYYKDLQKRYHCLENPPTVTFEHERESPNSLMKEM